MLGGRREITVKKVETKEMEGVMEWGSGKRGGIEMKGNKNICKRGFRQEVGKVRRMGREERGG